MDILNIGFWKINVIKRNLTLVLRKKLMLLVIILHQFLKTNVVECVVNIGFI